MVDFHSHILPGIDDGSRDTDMSLAMLAMEREQEVSHVVLTPHFYPQQDSVDKFLERRHDSLEQLKDAAHTAQQELPRLSVGAEVYYFRGIGQASMAHKLCIDEMSVFLLEMPFCQWEEAMYTDICQLIEKQGLTIVLAHIERYVPFQKRKNIWEAVMELPLYCQMNMNPFLDWKKRGKCLRLLQERGTVLMGSDAHNLTSRKPNLKEGQAMIVQKLGEQYLHRTYALEERLLGT